jgi:hypothetical protein
MCVMLLGGYLAGLKLTRVSATLLNMNGTCLLQSFSNNSTFIMLYLYHEMDVDYLVVHGMINIKNCLITLACAPMMLTT